MGSRPQLSNCCEILFVINNSPISFVLNDVRANKKSLSLVSLWHKRLGHLSFDVTNAIMTHSKVKFSKKDSTIYFACLLSKSKKLLFTLSQIVFTKPLQLISMDLWDLAPILSSNGFRYYINFVDHYSQYTWVVLLKTKSKALTTFVTSKT